MRLGGYAPALTLALFQVAQTTIKGAHAKKNEATYHVANHFISLCKFFKSFHGCPIFLGLT